MKKQKLIQPKQRKTWDEYFLEQAKLISSRSTCDRLSVGAVIVNGHRILSTGYNGSLKGSPHCDDIGHLLIDGRCKRTIHAEMNAISQAASYGINIDKAHIYITHSPCLECFKMILSSGITRIIFNELYRLTEKDIKIYNDIAGYRTLEIGNDKNDIEKYYYWHVSLDTKVWFKQ